jgi:1-acyl-sn-glycerol-3-phosphate acyltransferase
LILVVLWFAVWRNRYHKFVERRLVSGYIPSTFMPLVWLGKLISKLWIFLQVGRVQVVGAENLRPKGRVIFCGNHGAMFDAALAYSLMKTSARYMSAFEEMRGIWGLKAIVMGAVGCFPVDRSHGKTVIPPAIKVLVSGQNLVIFPEGKISPSGELLPFKLGPAWITNAAFDQLGGKEPVGIVPMHICYARRDPPTANIGNFATMGFKWRGGVKVVVGKPIYLHELPSRDPEQVMAAVRSFIVSQACPTTSGT